MYGSLAISMLSTQDRMQPLLLQYFSIESPIIPVEAALASRQLWALTVISSLTCVSILIGVITKKKKKVGIK
ncbi:hypothetical protein [Enterococcus sp. AZ196]|uniref:hypothetical protein n=1 Tax=Enterococcus sp. AZ196 TaxID=2774659 RepID=UPI003D2A8EA1